MRSSVDSIFSNPYRIAAANSVINGIDITYSQEWSMSKLLWLAIGKFTWNIDAALKRDRINHKKDDMWMAAEFVDERTIKDPIESAELYRIIDEALVKRLFMLKRIERKISGGK